jgi:hypothetical protein
LGLKVQHALRAFTAADRKTIKLAAQNYPETTFYDVDELLTTLGIGEALITLLNEKGIPTPLVHSMMLPPRSRMDVLTSDEIDAIVSDSKLVKKYNKEIDSESAYEILTEKIKKLAAIKEKEEEEKEEAKAASSGRKEKTFFDNPIVKAAGRTAATILTRSLLGALGLGTRSKSKSIF